MTGRLTARPMPSMTTRSAAAAAAARGAETLLRSRHGPPCPVPTTLSRPLLRDSGTLVTLSIDSFYISESLDCNTQIVSGFW